MYDLSVRKREQTDMREWLRGGASPFESRPALSFFARKSSNHAGFRGFHFPDSVASLLHWTCSPVSKPANVRDCQYHAG